MTEFKFLTIESLHKLYKQGNVSFSEIINLQIDHIKQVENKIYSLVNFNSEEYLKLSKRHKNEELNQHYINDCLLYTSPSPRDLSTSRMPSSA